MGVSIQSPPGRLRFGAFELDPASGELHQNGHKVALAPKAFELLRALVERPGQVVTREELRAKLWAADTFVEFDDALNHAVKKLRQALGDSAENPQFIETLPRYGYRFIALVDSPRALALKPVQGRRTVTAAVVVGAGLLVLVAALFAFNVGGWRARLYGSAATPPIRSLAVLPLTNLSGDPEQDYFADGMTDALITDLAKAQAVKVISRTSVMQFKNPKNTLPEIARTLRVDGIVEGSVQRSGEHVRITVQLVRAPTDTHLWAESYERDTRDVLSLQREIAQAVARAIKVTLSPEEPTQLTRSRSVNPEAYEAYLKGQSHWYRGSREHLDAALGYFELARQKDPNYARAYAGIANVWLVRGDVGLMAPSEAFPKSKEAVSKALALDESLSEAHVTRALLAGSDWDWSTAEREFRRGIELNPNSADGHFMYSDFLISIKRTEEWNREIQRTLELDPINPFFQCFYAWQLNYLGRYDEAIAQLRKVLETEPEFSSAHMGLWGAYYKKGMYREALAEARKFYAILHDIEIDDALVRGEAEGGYAQAMHLAADILAARARRIQVPAIRVARLYAHAGDQEKTLLWLRQAYEQHEMPLTHIRVAWDWDFLREDPRFQSLLHDMYLTR